MDEKIKEFAKKGLRTLAMCIAETIVSLILSNLFKIVKSGTIFSKCKLSKRYISLKTPDLAYSCNILKVTLF